ncbi:AAA family ATPase [Natronomonas sp. EA1]|uniref:AAA family ATPase n=1 Tax=Natronomonas sp. EA1 TaxID=3421655 RepID=UPI003EB83EC1
MLVVVCGLPGVGKTTVAERVVEQLDAEMLRTDVVRKELFPDPDYTDEESQAVYDELFSRTRDRLQADEDVVLDATFQEAAKRERARRVAEETGRAFELVYVRCDLDGVEKRIEQREGDESDADFEVHLLFRETFDPIEGDHVVVDNSDGLASTYEQVDAVF